MRNHVSVHIEATSPVEFHCDQEGDKVTLRLDSCEGPVHVFLTGTPAQMLGLADRLVMEAHRQQAKIDARKAVAA